jgi:FixJ family two-component response regulator
MDREPLIYIVDDDESVRTALGRLVRSVGMRAETFASPEEVIRHRSEENPEILLLDVQLPGMSGFELRGALSDAGLEAPVIFITAHPESYRWYDSEASDAVACLEKPFGEEALLAAIREALGAGAPPRTDER